MTGTIIDQAKIALKSPLTYGLIIIAWIASYFVAAYNDRSNDTITQLSRDCKEQITRLNVRITVLEKMHDEYTRAMLFKDIQTREQAIIIDSLKRQ